jgi:tetratricopeptide (TPR) repeat protein
MIGILLALICSGGIFGCAPRLTVLQKGQMTYMQGQVADAEQTLLPLEQNVKDKDYPLFLLTLGTVELSMGDYQRAEKYFLAGVTNLSAELSGAQTAMAVAWKSESSRPYRGYPHEKVLAHTYLSLCYLQQGKLDDARVECAKVREEHRGEKAGQEDDFLATHVLEGLTAMRAERYNDAQVSFRKVTELKPDFALGWYCLARASQLNRSAEEAQTAGEKYDSLTDEQNRLALDGSTPCALFLIDAGWGAYRKPDIAIGQFAQWVEFKTPVAQVALASGGQGMTTAYPADDLFFQANTEGGLAGDATRKLASAAAKTALRQVPILGMFTPKSEADLRCWAISPGKIYMGAVPIPKAPSTVEVAVRDAKDKPMDSLGQMLYYIGGQPFDQAQIVYARLLPDAETRETLRNPPRKK